VSRKLALLVNPASAGGKALRVLPGIEAELKRLGADYRVVTSDSGDHAKQLARAMAEGDEVAVAVGGDGLVGTLAGALDEQRGAMAIIPTGRGNDFARVLGIPKDPAEAARLAATGEERLLDVGRVDGKTFVGIASAGFDSDANRIANAARIVRGNLVYFYAGLRALIAWKPAHFTVTIDGEPHEVDGFNVLVANSKAYGGGMYPVPQAELDDGMLDVMLTADMPKLRGARCMQKTFKGEHVDEPEFSFFRGKVVEIAADRPFTVYADGDPLAELPATVTVAKQTLRVIVP
jgi:YegS/Rv2252/BmrU family lipid kinase